MEPRTQCRIAGLLVLLLAAGCALDDRGAVARQALRSTTQLIRAVVPASPPATSLTMGVRG